jgi:hypothetical protein
MKKLLLVCVAVVAACSPEGSGEITGHGGAALVTPEWDSPDCEEPHGNDVIPESEQDAAERFEGAWALCSGRLAAPAPGDAAGVAFEGGRMHYLVRGSGGLVRGGHSTAVDWGRPRMGGTNNEGGLSFERPEQQDAHRYRIAASGRFLQLESTGYEPRRARFVRASRHRDDPNATSAQPPAAESPPSSPPPTCPTIDPRTKLFVPTDVEMKKKLAGRWRVCAGALPGRPDVRGIEFLLEQLDRSNRAYHLVERDGALVRGFGWDYDYRAFVFDTKLFNGPGVYQLSIIGGPEGYGGIARMSADADVLELTLGNTDVRLVRVPSP